MTAIPKPPPVGPCRKKRYTDEAAARAELEHIWKMAEARPGQRPKIETRCYPCPDCHGAYHLTSSPKKGSTRCD